ncbi:hypothetical protein Leryth_014997 [Lithospermum erythrorhizon]|nr:hypothetical protein Leryth_014997 [Lithospermum erythrorhizon]
MHTTLVQLVCRFYRRLKSFTTMEFILQADVWQIVSGSKLKKPGSRARTGNAQSQKPAAHPPPQAKAAAAIQAKGNDQERIEKQEEKGKTTREEGSRGRFLI